MSWNSVKLATVLCFAMSAVSYEPFPLLCRSCNCTSRYGRFAEHFVPGRSTGEIFVCCQCLSMSIFDCGWFAHKTVKGELFLVGAPWTIDMEKARRAWCSEQCIAAMAETAEAKQKAVVGCPPAGSNVFPADHSCVQSGYVVKLAAATLCFRSTSCSLVCLSLAIWLPLLPQTIRFWPPICP